MQGRHEHGSFTATCGRARLAGRVRSAGLALFAASLGAALLASGASATGLPQGPPAGPTGPTRAPFTQCPPIGEDTSCEYLIDVTSGHPAVRVLRDATQPAYDRHEKNLEPGEKPEPGDDVTIAVQNDTTAPLETLHIGVSGAKGHLFAFDGDGLCWSKISPKPAGCPFGSVSYDGPDTTLLAESSGEAGTVVFNTPLGPGQYTYFALEAAPTEVIVAGAEVNDTVNTTLTNTQTHEEGDALSSPAPVEVSDKAQIKGEFQAEANGEVEYLLYKDPGCHELVESLGKKKVTAGVAEASSRSSVKLATNATYYWIAEYTGSGRNSANRSACGSETMAFGAPAGLPQPQIATLLSGGGQVGSHITVSEGTEVTDTAIITSPGGQQVTGSVAYAAYTNALCTGEGPLVGGGGETSGVGPSTDRLTLVAGTYYFRAFYSGESGVLRGGSTRCGDEVLTVLARPHVGAKPGSPSAPAGSQQGPASGAFKLLAWHLDESNGQITVTVQTAAAGSVSVSAIVKEGASLARVQLHARAARHKVCRRGFVVRRGRCASNAPALYGAASLTSSTPGTYRLVIKPSKRVLAALRRGEHLHVTLTVTFEGRSGGAPVTHLVSVLAKLKKSAHTHKRH
jgi:hypothetical protein